jgi:hypothetical protein
MDRANIHPTKGMENNDRQTMSRKQYRVFLVLVFVVITLPAAASAEQVKIRGDYCYQYGDSESLLAAKEISYAMALRKAIERYKTFVASTSIVDDFQLRKDLIETIVSGYVENIEIEREDIAGRNVCTELVGSVNPEAVKDIIAKKIKILSGQGGREYDGIVSNLYLKVINYKIDTDSGGNKLLRVFYQIKQSPPLGGTRMAVFCFDEEGNPIQTSFCDIVASSSFRGAFGKQTCVIPAKAVSINIRF